MALTPETRVTPHPDVVWRLVDNEVVLLNVSTGLYFSLDAIGSRIWALVPTDGTTLSAVRETLLAEYDATADQIDQGLNDLFGQLIAAGLVVIP